MSILNVIEYEEGVAIIEDNHGRYAVTKDDDTFVPLDFTFADIERLDLHRERERMLT